MCVRFGVFYSDRNFPVSEQVGGGRQEAQKAGEGLGSEDRYDNTHRGSYMSHSLNSLKGAI